ncbi:class I SAM-dependent methyltransferase [Arenimonas sp. MALMAid1274]|uniref:class I SAM-dependent methyltransferase n=1 Tax=Arenimonas sp. MALMAid1274 TaxID=3411630 RepID=UPI003B9EBE68
MALFDRFRPAPRWLPGAPSGEAPASVAYDSHAAFIAVLDGQRARFDAQWRLQCEVAAATGTSGWPGWCGLCSQPVAFALPSTEHGAAANLREELVCPGCRLTARNRAALALLCHGLPLDSARVYLTEQASAAYVWLQQRCPGLMGSEFGFDDAGHARLTTAYRALGGRGDIVARDVTALDFATGSLDAIGCFDVLEHVPDYRAALAEFARCLTPGGRLALTVPFLERDEATLVRARLDAQGAVQHLCEPEIHGDPVNGGVLCFYHFGWDLLASVRAAGFRDAQWVRTWSPREGLFGLFTLMAVR